MTSRVMDHVMKSYDPTSILGTLYQYVVDDEHDVKISQELKDYFASTTDIGREWGHSSYGGDFTYTVTEQDGEDGFLIHYEKADYCRSCYMGQIHDRLFIPDSLVEAWEKQFSDEFDDEEAFRQALRAYNLRRVETLKAGLEAQQEKKRQEALAEQERREAQEREEFARLQAKYGSKQ